jgi:acyl-CoA dehydrogenase family protein 9
LERYTGALHQAAERLIREHRDRVVDEQLQLARLADVAIDLFALTAVIGRVHAIVERRGESAALHEIDLARQFSREAGARIDARLTGLAENRDARVRRIADQKAPSRVGEPAGRAGERAGRDGEPAGRPGEPAGAGPA